MAFKNLEEKQIQNILRNAQTIAVVGLSNKEDRTSYQVAKYMQEKGYTILPVNPMLAETEVLGEKVYGSLEDIQQPIDIVDVFRKSEYLPEVAESFLKIDAEVFWAQLGLYSEEAATILEKAGREKIIMDRCLKIEWDKMND